MARQVKLMLVKDVTSLGALGDEVKVRSGYARNYLLPKGLAAPVNKDAVKRVAAERKKAAMIEKKVLDQAKATQEMLRSISLHIEAKAGEGGHLYGSVSGAMIAEALSKQGVRVDESAVQLDNPIKELGIYQVSLRLHADALGLVKVYVVAPPPEKGDDVKGKAAPDAKGKLSTNAPAKTPVVDVKKPAPDLKSKAAPEVKGKQK